MNQRKIKKINGNKDTGLLPFLITPGCPNRRFDRQCSFRQPRLLDGEREQKLLISVRRGLLTQYAWECISLWACPPGSLLPALPLASSASLPRLEFGWRPL